MGDPVLVGCRGIGMPSIPEESGIRSECFAASCGLCRLHVRVSASVRVDYGLYIRKNALLGASADRALDYQSLTDFADHEVGARLDHDYSGALEAHDTVIANTAWLFGCGRAGRCGSRLRLF